MEYGLLIAAIIRCGLKDDGLDYLQTPGGQYWCLLGNVDPEVVRERAEGTSQGLHLYALCGLRSDPEKDNFHEFPYYGDYSCRSTGPSPRRSR